MPEMREVYSSRVSEIGYEDGNLIVRWAKGRPGKEVSIYEGVPQKLAEEVMNAASIGQALRNAIESAYPHRYA